MKLRLRSNSLRLRLNQLEVRSLAAGEKLVEGLAFPDSTRLKYALECVSAARAQASFENGTIRILAPRGEVAQWADSDAIGMYFELPAEGTQLRIAIEKDLECVEGPPAERDPHAFPRERSC